MKTRRSMLLFLLPFVCVNCAGVWRRSLGLTPVVIEINADDVPLVALVVRDHVARRQGGGKSDAIVYALNLSTGDTKAILSTNECSSLKLISVNQLVAQRSVAKHSQNQVRTLSVSLHYSKSRAQCDVVLDDVSGPVAAENWRFECRKTRSGWIITSRTLLNVA